MSVIRDGVDRLKRGEEVMEWLRSKCSTTASLSCTMSRIRGEYMKAVPVPPCVEEAMSPFRGAEKGVASFLSLSLSEMVKTQREHRSSPEWSEAAEEALASLKLLPPNVEEMKLSHRELVSLKRRREETVLHKQEQLCHVRGAAAWLHHAIALARTSTPDMPFPRLAIPLLLLSGRRTTELMNGRSSFLPLGRATTCFFSGQIKKRGQDGGGYEIPLLCDYSIFVNALAVLRSKQGGEVLDSVECNNRYAQALRAGVGTVFPFAACPHTLRAVYASFCYHLYSSEVTFNRAAMRILGHEKLEVSLSYNSVVLHEAGPAGRWGPLP